MFGVGRLRAFPTVLAFLVVAGAGACSDGDEPTIIGGSGDGVGQAGTPGRGGAEGDDTDHANAGSDVGAGSGGDAGSDVGAGSGGDAGAVESNGGDPTEALFAADHVVQVEIDIPSEDWDALRSEGRSLVRAMIERGYFYDYTYFDADVTIDGDTYEDVGVRKKGFLGSISLYRPSVKLDLNRNVEGQSHSGVKKLTLNNNRQDPSNTRQCLSYRLFAQAGLPAPRCNLARVFVNGEDLGTYTNLEPVGKAMLRRHFEDPDGNLYEGQAADFDRETVGHFEVKTNEEDADRKDLERIVEALERPDDEVVAALGELVDLDSFRTYWAMEALVGHWDSYSGNANNFYVYHDPTSDLLYFIPWGMDSSFDGLVPFGGQSDITVFAAGKIASRLYGLPEERERYRERLAELVEDVWDEEALLAQVDQIAELAPETPQADLDAQRAFIETRAENMLAALAEPASDWVNPTPSGESECEWMTSDVDVEFATEWGDLMSPPVGEFTVEMSLDGQDLELGWSGSAGWDMFTGAGPVLQMTATLPDQRLLFFFLTLAPNTMKPGVWPLHGLESWGSISVVNGAEFRMLTYVGDGEVTFEEASTEPGAPVVGHLHGTVVQLECLNP